MKRQGIVRVCKSAGTETWTGMATETPLFDRGFTGHEHLYAFGLINMNGRMYDPLMSSFLSVDAYVQDPTNAQAFNRYAYCGHNPLRYTDPTGWYRDGYGCQNIQQNYDPTARWHSDDPNDVLWGRTVHPCANTSSGFVNGTPYTNTNYAQGNSGLNGCNYTVDEQGYVKNVGSNDKDCDILYTAEAYAAGNLSNGLIVYDENFLAGLIEDREDYWVWSGNFKTRSGHYSSTESIDEAFKVYFFMTQNTDVEWAISGFRTDGPNEYVINTTHFQTTVKLITESEYYSEYNMIFNIHNHNLVDGTKGGSGDHRSGDMSYIIDLHKKFQNKDIHQWCVINGVKTKFPTHYVYHNESSVLYHYTPTQSSIYIRKINTYQDLYRNLGF